MKRFIVLMMLILICFTAGCSYFSSQKDVYYVMFGSQPNLYDTNVYCFGKAIGKILGNEKIALNSTKVTVKIDNEYRELIKDNVVFYEDLGKLNYTTIGSMGKVVEPGTKILGFDSKLSLYWFKTRTALSQSSLVAARRANQLYQQGEKQY